MIANAYSDRALFQPASHDMRPERDDSGSHFLEETAQRLLEKIVIPFQTRLSSFAPLLREIDRCGQELTGKNDTELREIASSLRFPLNRHGFREQYIARTFALVREIAGRKLGMRHFPCQLIGGAVMLDGMIAEMETGEGKTLVATLTASVAALAGIPVHVISVNDYLTSRDAEEMTPVYHALGLKVGCITHEVDLRARREAYACDITYVTNKEVVFDYLRDRITLGERPGALTLQAENLYNPEKRSERLLMRGLHFAIVDEADSILIDEARTPLLISRAVESDEESGFMRQAMELAGRLAERQDFVVRPDRRSVDITGRGAERIAALAAGLGPLWTSAVRRVEIVRQALTAVHLFHRDENYLVQDGKIQIVDEFTGRIMADRSWEKGLHQMIEIKEGCAITSQMETIARISYQKFFRKYLRLAGMTGTALEVSNELHAVYRIPVVRIPTNRPVKRKAYPERIFPTIAEKWQAVVASISRMRAQGRPVLCGTRSVAASEQLSALLTEAGIEHKVLNAKFDKEEAEIIARGGEIGSITIATNMAGRGTDIKLAPGVAGRQGLHVILTERHEAARIDRQLVGRCGRQGDPGSWEAILSLEDNIFAVNRIWLVGALVRRFLSPGTLLWDRLAGYSIRRAQKKMERRHARMRRDLLRQDKQLRERLSFSGYGE